MSNNVRDRPETLIDMTDRHYGRLKEFVNCERNHSAWLIRAAENGSGRRQARLPTPAMIGKHPSPVYSSDLPLPSSLSDEAGLGLEVPPALHGVPGASQLDEPSPLLHCHAPSAQHEAPSKQVGLSPIPG